MPRLKDCTGMREATIEGSAGCPAAGPLTRRSVDISVGSYDRAQPAIIPAVRNSQPDSGSTKIVLWAGSKVTPKISVTCVAYTQPDGEPVMAKGSATGNTIKTAPVAYTGYIEYSRSPRGVLLGNYRGKKVRGAIRHGKEVRLFWGAAHDESLRKGYGSVKVHIRAAAADQAAQAGQIKVWVTVSGVRSLNTLKLRGV